MSVGDAAEFAQREVDRVRDDPHGRLRSLRRLYETADPASPRLPYRRAATSFMKWQLRRGLLAPTSSTIPGSPWWRAVNERLLHDGWEAAALARGIPGTPSSAAVELSMRFIAEPTASNWYRAHNASIVSAYQDNRALAGRESRSERFFINLVLMRVLYAHALVSAPRLALSWLAPLAPVLGDPRLGMTGMFLSISRVLPARYPLCDDVEIYVADEHGFGRLLDVGVIGPRLPELYAWSAAELEQSQLSGWLAGSIPTYVWPETDRAVWDPHPGTLAAGARRILAPRGRSTP
ncbi:hypothetical protein HH308_23660 [Gordonia sp. TBRC 11910]|uniref:Uncharacterized protein n=1 Tax=Gordonia asplenii TaxID=2725283 RepID=A0A848L0K1_9ACTN|nr:hypothetical protein [Gordonia asplenii]NMO04219.1 hypothetical protein [Gordonia asplenii]